MYYCRKVLSVGATFIFYIKTDDLRNPKQIGFSRILRNHPVIKCVSSTRHALRSAHGWRRDLNRCVRPGFMCPGTRCFAEKRSPEEKSWRKCENLTNIRIHTPGKRYNIPGIRGMHVCVYPGMWSAIYLSYEARGLLSDSVGCDAVFVFDGVWVGCQGVVYIFSRYVHGEVRCWYSGGRSMSLCVYCR